jgi:mRNA interferase RelE/StbE
MPTYDIVISKRAAKDIKKLPKDDQRKVVLALDALAENPRPRGVEKLKSNPAFWRICIGHDKRMIYTIDDKERLVLVALVRFRKDAYRGLGDLDAEQLIKDTQPLRAQLQAPGPPQ